MRSSNFSSMNSNATSSSLLLERISAHKQIVADIRRRAQQMFDEGASGSAIAVEISRAHDEFLVALYDQALEQLSIEHRALVERHAAMVAVGGTGRGELAPYSDIDLLFVFRKPAASVFQRMAAQIVRDCWDAGIELGHSVRSMQDTLAMARDEPIVLTGLVEVRQLSGSRNVFRSLRRKVRRLISGQKLRQFIDTCVASRNTERAAHGGAVNCLQPDVKRSMGGLRDLHLIRWVGCAVFGRTTIDGLKRCGALKSTETKQLHDAYEFLTHVRVDLHLAAGRTNDLLSRDEQLRIADRQGVDGTPGLRPVERFMQDYFRHCSAIAGIAQQFVERHRPHSVASRLVRFLGTHRADGVLRVGGGYIDAAEASRREVCGSPEDVLRLYLTCALYGVVPAPPLAEEIQRAMADLAHDGELSTEAADYFLEILSRDIELGPLLRSMYHTGILEHVIPAMRHARCLLQFNQYHSYTVDEHTLRTLEAIDKMRAESSPLGVACRNIQQLQILRLALLLHDLGKGFEEDHSEVGRRIAIETAARLNLSIRTSDRLVFLVHQHLYMSHIGLRRDTSDPDVLIPFSHAVGSPNRLRMLYVLTAADLTAVGPGVFTPWKADLLSGLFDRAMLILSGKPYRYMEDERLQAIKEHVLAAIVPIESDDSEQLAAWIDEQTDAFSPHYLMSTTPAQIAADLNTIHQLQPGQLVVDGRNEVETGTVDYRIIAAADLAEGCFHKLAGALTAQRLKIVTARICTTTDGTVVDSFRVFDDDFTGAVPAERIEAVAASIRKALTSKTPIEQLFQRHLRFNSARAAEPVSNLPSRVTIDNDSSDSATIIDVFAHDRPGLLYTVARAIFSLDLSINLARIATHLDQVVDVFYVTESNGVKIDDDERIDFVRKELEEAVAEFEREGHLLFAR